METNWIPSEWKKEQLDGQSVEITRENRSVPAKFVVKSNDSGLLSIVVQTEERQTHVSWVLSNRVLQKEEADRIQRHPNQSVAAFLLAY